MNDLADTFCKSVPKLPRIYDPTRLAHMVACLRKHYYATYRGLRLRGEPSVHLAWGKAYHECTERFDLCLSEGLSAEAATQRAMTLAFDISWDYVLKQPKWGQYVDLFQCTDPEYKPGLRKVEHMVLNRDRCKYARKPQTDIPLGKSMAMNVMICRECGHRIERVRTWFHAHSKKTRGNLLRAVALYCDTPGLPPYAFSDKSPATEVQHMVPLSILSPDELTIQRHLEDGVEETTFRRPYELLVNIDSISEFDDAPAIRERKTTGLSRLDWRFWQQYEMCPQLDTYDLVGNVFYADGDQPVKVIVEATRVSNKGETEIQRAPITIGPGRRAEWFAELQEVIKDVEARTIRAAEYEAAHLDPTVHFPRRTTACITKNGVCPYWKLCTAEPEDRETLIEAHYRVEHWNPLTATAEAEEED
jgi:hypothetical protein